MGSAITCEKCPAAASSSVFTFSENLVLKLTEGVDPKPEPVKEGQVRDLNDREWMEKMDCIEDTHTNAYSLSDKGFDRIEKRLQRQLAVLSERDVCLEKLKECYKRNPGHTLKCEEEVNEFIDRVDIQRLKIMKEKYLNRGKS